ncbi:ferric siderophore ABC transporter substrate-binding protein [Chryseobacterium sp.]|uniref:ferric siderophore ABC transporter substrate-binding protein n=1 Tax=Chryseobacterium sp. TaxID=1871047 RepID=UPI0011C95BBE|nr:ferric siderophore ABC transporter substrate-binding protein [Chryseobacterium sp.]TXF76051.1 ferric siderophore ABC transporter substrate-binding protein [Chryseobacterium sp.]
MNDYSINNQEENRDRLKSGVITALVWSAVLLFVFLYKVTERIPEEKEVVTRILVNFGDNRNGNGLEEPANQDGSLAAEATLDPETSAAVLSKSEENKLLSPDKKVIPNEKILTGTQSKTSVKISEKNTKTTTKPSSASNTKKSGSKATTANSKTGSGDGKGTAAIGNLIKGRGTKAGTQGTNGTIGNQGDPLGGDGNGDSTIGIDRKLTGYIPGTMGRGGSQPSHSCSASGSITISYTVDKNGNVVSARRSGGISDPCVVSTSIGWVKKYVKAENAPTFSSGTYRISF